MGHVANLFNTSRTAKYLISYHKPRDIISDAGFMVEHIGQCSRSVANAFCAWLDRCAVEQSTGLISSCGCSHSKHPGAHDGFGRESQGLCVPRIPSAPPKRQGSIHCAD